MVSRKRIKSVSQLNTEGCVNLFEAVLLQLHEDTEECMRYLRRVPDDKKTVDNVEFLIKSMETDFISSISFGTSLRYAEEIDRRLEPYRQRVKAAKKAKEAEEKDIIEHMEVIQNA